MASTANVAMAGALACLPVAATHATGAHYHQSPVVISGASSVLASVLNDHGAIAGQYQDAAGLHGFVRSNGSVTVLPNLCQGSSLATCVPHPTAITSNGLIAGYLWNGASYDGFIWHDGVYVGGAAVGSFGCETADVYINRRGLVAFNQCVGSGFSYPFAGPYQAPKQISVGNFAYVASINGHGTVAGVYRPFVGNLTIQSLFIYSAGTVTTVLPPGAQSASGGLLNESGQLAGTYVDTSNATHGFLYQHGNYTSFDVPGAATQINVQAINAAGHVAGVFLDIRTLQQRVFVLTGTGVKSFGNFAAADTVTVAINDKGELLVVDAASAAVQSYRVSCDGTEC